MVVGIKWDCYSITSCPQFVVTWKDRLIRFELISMKLRFMGPAVLLMGHIKGGGTQMVPSQVYGTVLGFILNMAGFTSQTLRLWLGKIRLNSCCSAMSIP